MAKTSDQAVAAYLMKSCLRQGPDPFASWPLVSDEPSLIRLQRTVRRTCQHCGATFRSNLIHALADYCSPECHRADFITTVIDLTGLPESAVVQQVDAVGPHATIDWALALIAAGG